MKKDKRILLAITGIALLLGGCGANQPKQKTNNHKEVKTENVKSDVQSSTATSQVSSNKLSMNDLSSPKLLAAAVIDFAGNADQNGVWSNTTNEWNNELNSPSKQWTIQDDGTGEMEAFPTRNLPDANAADSCPTTYTAKGDNISIWESGTTRNVSKNDILSFVNGEYKLPSSQNSNGNVDTKNLTTQQVNNWVYQAMLKTYYTGNEKPPMDALDFEQNTDDSGCVEILVRENHDSDWMKERGAMQGVNPTIATFRVDAQGNLQQNDYGDGGWKDTNIPYPGN